MLRGFDFRTADIGAGVAVAYAMMIEFAEDEDEVEKIRTALRSEPVSLRAAIQANVIEGDQIIPTMVPSWWTSDNDAYAGGVAAASAFARDPKGGGI